MKCTCVSPICYFDKNSIACSEHAEEASRARAKMWVKSALFQLENGKTIPELRKFYLGDEA